MKTVRVFAYGSNLCIERIRARTPSAAVVGTAVLVGHDLRWHKRSRDGSGKCDIVETQQSADRVWGALYELSLAEKTLLDGFEGLGEDYFEKTVRVRAGSDRDLDALAYVANPGLLDATARPYHWYKGFVVTGAVQHALPGGYRESLDAVEALDDPDPERHLREWSVLEEALRRLR